MSYIGVPPFGQTIRSVTNITATTSQTDFNIVGGYRVGYVDVYLNGVLLIPTTDYTATDGLTVVLTSAASSGDAFQALSYQPVSLQDTYRKAEVDDLIANIDALPDQTGNSGKYLSTDGSTASWQTINVTPALDDLTDVAITSAATGEVLQYNGSGWVNAEIATGNSTTLGLWENASTITANYTITAGNNAMSAGPITVDSGVTVTVPSGSTWTVV